MRTKRYDREKAVAYAHRWAMARNPAYYDFQNLGGDCTNFASQVLYAGAGVMNFTPTFGWYYRGVGDYAPAWTGVEYLYRFLTKNLRAGPVAVEAELSRAEPGDVVQLAFERGFQHSPVVVSVGNPATPENILVAAHTYDADNRPLKSYNYTRARLLHITHVNAW